MNNSPVRRLFVEFSIGGLTQSVVSAKLRLHVEDLWLFTIEGVVAAYPLVFSAKMP